MLATAYVVACDRRHPSRAQFAIFTLFGSKWNDLFVRVIDDSCTQNSILGEDRSNFKGEEFEKSSSFFRGNATPFKRKIVPTTKGSENLTL